MPEYHPGQRWATDSEPELGLGIVLATSAGRVEMFFPAAALHRQYATESAPLRRVVFAPGDVIETHGGESITVETVSETLGTLIYKGGGRSIAESELSDFLGFLAPEDRLLAGRGDVNDVFTLRVEALRWRARIRESAVRGFVGGRVELIPHQLSIASEVARRRVPRVLLADEVGLGKTIEAGLILHRLHLVGRAERILILVPEPLLHQWFVEMLRRFNLLFSVVDADRAATSENVFAENPLVLCATQWIAQDEAQSALLHEAGWDLVVVDEAHHLHWSAEGESAEYALVRKLAASASGVLLLTATPEQLGTQSHFARLHLLDPVRYPSLEDFEKEAALYPAVADAVKSLRDGAAPDLAVLAQLGSPGVDSLVARLDADGAREELIDVLLDEFGTGRLLFRNMRSALRGFPKRQVHPAPLQDDESRMPWLVELLQQHVTEKFLLICKSKELAVKVVDDLRDCVRVGTPLFHEDLTLIQRDRNAAYFAEADGARLLVCSEIGSEGRNFQFAHHLVLFDLPENPELLEQRIGRLDRIGQTGTIHIHVPYVIGSDEEIYFRWYHEGLQAFEHCLHGAAMIHAEIAELLERACADHRLAGELVQATAQVRERVSDLLAAGKDSLITQQTSRPGKAQELIAAICEAQTDGEFAEFVKRLLDFHGVELERLAERSYLLKPGILYRGAIPGMQEQGMSATFDRQRALHREEWGFLTMDHPVVCGALDAMLGGESGNAAVVFWRESARKGMLLELHGVMECPAPAHLHVDRYLPPRPVRVVVDHTGSDLSEDPDVLAAEFEDGESFRILEQGLVKKKLFPVMLEAARKMAEEKGDAMSFAAATRIREEQRKESTRVRDLAARWGVSPEQELAALEQLSSELLSAVRSARLRVDALRLVLAGT